MRVAAIVAASLWLHPGCAHRQLTNQEVAIGAIAVAFMGGLVYLAVTQCEKGVNYCENKPPPNAR